MTAPVTAAPPRFPVLRLYDGNFSTPSPFTPVTFVQAGRNGANQWSHVPTAGKGATATFGIAFWGPHLGQVPANATMIAALITDSAVTVTAPAGWTQATTVTNGSIKLSAFYKLSTGAEGETAAFSLSASCNYAGVLYALQGVTISSPLDKTATASSTNTSTTITISTGTTAATAQANEAVIAVWGANMGAGSIGIGGQSPGFVMRGGVQWNTLSLAMGDKFVSATGTQTAQAFGNSYSSAGNTGVGLVLTLKGDAAPRRFTPLAEIEAWQGQATASLAEIGELTGVVQLSDPATAFLTPNTIVEVYLPRQVCADGTVIAGRSFEWYYLRHLEQDTTDSQRGLYRFGGPSLKMKVAERVSSAAAMTALHGPTTNTATTWMRSLVTATCITPTAGSAYTDPVPGLALESSPGTTGTVYSDVPFGVGEPNGTAIAKLCRADSIGWRVVVVNPGATTAALQFQTFAGTTRTIGSSSEAVLCTQWDTARSVRPIKDANQGITSLTALGPASGAVQTTFTATDAQAIADWGLVHGFLDMRNATYLTQAMVNAELNARKPKFYCTVTASDAPYCQIDRHYWLGDTLTVLSPKGDRFDGQVTSLTCYSSGNLQQAQSGLDLWQPQPVVTGPTAPPVPIIGRRGAIGTVFEMVVGPDPAVSVNYYRAVEPTQLFPYTHLPGLVKTATDINSVAANATANPRQAGTFTATSAGSPSVTAVSNPGTIGSQTIGSSTNDADAPKASDVIAAIANIVTQLNNLSNHFPNAAGITSTSTAVATVNSSAQSAITAHNGTATQLTNAAITT